MKRIALALALLAVVGLATANGAHAEELEVGHGLVTPNSPFYGLEVAMDNAAVSVGLARAGNIAQERAAEAKEMQENNNTRGMQKALDNLNNIVQRATSRDTEGLEKASSVLQEVMANAPGEAQQGLQTALDNIDAARQRAGQAPDEAPRNAQERISAAEDLREQGRQALQDGNTLLDQGNLSGARDQYSQAESYFSRAESQLSGIQTQEASQLRQQLQDSISGADNLEKSVQAEIDGNTQQAQDYAQQAQQDFQSTGGVQ